MRFGSVCSGIEAASVAWDPMGWGADWLAEIEEFPSAVLRERWPEIPNLGDMTQIPRQILQRKVPAPDVLVGGTPCQSFSVAGMREGLNDPRGQLTIKYVELIDAIDHVRERDGEQPAIAVWENVPGALSDKGNAFGCFLGALVGEECELQPAGKKWSDSGCVYGPKRSAAWRILDAQHFGLAQRRRRVFVVSSAREGFDPAKILFEWEGVRRDTPPSREAEQGSPSPAQSSIDGDSGERGRGVKWPAELASTLNAAFGSKQGIEDQHINSGAPLFVPVCFGQNRMSGPVDVSHALSAHGGPCGRLDFMSETFAVQAFPAEMSGTQAATAENISPALSVKHTTAVAFAQNSRGEVRVGEVVGPLSGGGGTAGQGYPAAATIIGARRLTPLECERLQGFPEGYTAIAWNGRKPEDCPDGHRYKALGNSMAVPVMAWIGERIRDYVAALEEAA